jgi:sulfur carrier protein
MLFSWKEDGRVGRYATGWQESFHECDARLKCALPGTAVARRDAGTPGNRDNGAMEIRLNGAEHSLPPDCSVARLLADAGLGERRVAVEVNGAIVPRSAHDGHRLQEGDRVEIVHALGGG